MIDAIGGSVTTEAQSLDNSSINQEDFIRLFLAQLSNQDPMEPVDNSEFLAQMAQFTGLEQTRLMNENLTSMLGMESSSQGLSLLGRNVQVNSSTGTFEGAVEGVQFDAQGLRLTIKNSSDEFLTDVSLTDITLVQE